MTPDLGAQTKQENPSSTATTSQKPEDRRWDLVITQGALERKTDGKKVPATLGNVIDYLRDVFPANIVLAPGVRDLDVGDLKLAAFRWEPGLEALRVASGNAFTWRAHPDRAGAIDPTTGLPVTRESSDSDLLVLTPDESPAQKRMVEVFNLAGFVQGQDKEKVTRSIDEILQIIHQTLDQVGEKGGVDVYYHPSASLLVMSGTPEKVEIAKKVLLALPQVSASRATDSASPSRKEEAERQARERLMQRYGISPGQAPTPSAAAPSTPSGANRY